MSVRALIGLISIRQETSVMKECTKRKPLFTFWLAREWFARECQCETSLRKINQTRESSGTVTYNKTLHSIMKNWTHYDIFKLPKPMINSKIRNQV